MKEISDSSVLSFVNPKAQIKRAAQELQEERTGIQTGVVSRFPKMNLVMMKYFRFHNIITMAGASGAGKSFFLNMLRDDFTDTIPIKVKKSEHSPRMLNRLITCGRFVEDGQYISRPSLNANLTFEPLFLNFSYEMNFIKDMYRTCSNILGYSYSYIVSSKKLGVNTKGKDVFNRLEDDEYKMVMDIFTQVANRRNVITFPSAGNLVQFQNTIYKAKNQYHTSKISGKPIKHIVGLDHTLLNKKIKESNDLELQDSLAKLCIDIRDQTDNLIILLAQMNSQMEDDRRRNNPKLHYPTKKDIYMGGQLYQASDFVMTLLMPAKLGISAYGSRKVPTNRLIHGSFIKSRYDFDGQLWFRNDLHEGRITTVTWDKNHKNMVEIPDLREAI